MTTKQLTTPRPARRSWIKIVLLQGLLIPLLLIVAETSVRIATDYDGEATRVRLSEIIESMQSGVPNPARDVALEKIVKADLRLHPYTGFGPKQLVSSHNWEFKRLAAKPPEDEYRIMILGGSVAAGFGNPSSAGVNAVQKILEADPRFEGRKIRFIRQGFGSYKQPQQLILTSYLLGAGVRPHAIISLDGFNEVALSLQNSSAGMNPAYPSFSQWIHLTSRWGSDTELMVAAINDLSRAREACLSIAAQAERFGTYRSSLLGPRLLKNMLAERRAFAIASRRYTKLLTQSPSSSSLSGPEYIKDDEVVVEGAVQMWAESTRLLDAICARHNIFFMNVLQPTLHDKGSKVVTKLEEEKGQAHYTWIRGVELGYPKLRAEGKQLRAEGLHYLDASMAFLETSKTLYFDACHFSQAGYSILGRLIGEAYLEGLHPGELPR